MYAIGRREAEAVRRVIESGQLFRYRGGEKGPCDQFEARLCGMLGAGHALLVNQGTSALICGLVACDIGPGDEVIVPSYTFMATPLAVLAVGAVPIIVEIDASLTIDPAAVEAAITSRTKAIIPVHMNGWPCDMRAIMRLSRKHGLKVIEDACQAVGGSYKGRRLGTIGHAGAYSFNVFKILTCGEGGALVTNDALAYHKALIHHDGGCAFRGHLLEAQIFTGWSFRTSAIQGAIMLEQLKRLGGILSRLRARKRAIVEGLAGGRGYKPAPVRCAEGDCGLAAAVQMPGPEQCRRAIAMLKKANNTLVRGTPIDSGIHVYSNWEPVLKQWASNHRGRNAFRLTEKKYTYAKDMCPRTLELLGRSLFLGTNYDQTPARHRTQARRARAILEQAAKAPT